MIDLGHWTTKIPIQDEIPYGFIYRITCKPTNKQYIGKKQCKFVKKRRPLKGKKNKRHEICESDWKTYTSSSVELNKDIEALGKDQFVFEIIKFCDSKFALAYEEAKIQFEEEVLFKEQYYNGIINLRVSRPKHANRSQDTIT